MIECMYLMVHPVQLWCATIEKCPALRKNQVLFLANYRCSYTENFPGPTYLKAPVLASHTSSLPLAHPTTTSRSLQSRHHTGGGIASEAAAKLLSSSLSELLQLQLSGRTDMRSLLLPDCLSELDPKIHLNCTKYR